MTDIHIISDNLTLEQKCSEWQEKSYITIDTEFLRTSTYWPRLCLIQVGFNGEGCLLDPLAEGLTLEPFFDVLKNPKVLKVFHDARQDIEIIHHLAAFCPSPIFDSQIAAAACGLGDSVSYESLVRTFIHKNIDKSARVTDWSKRPLSDKQKRYALSDVTYLCAIYEKLLGNLNKLNRLEWVLPEFEVLTQPSFYQNPPAQAWQNLRFHANNERQQAVLEALAEWREEEAQRLDIPRGWVLRDEVIKPLMLAAANQAPLHEVRGFPKKLVHSKGGESLNKKISQAQKRPLEEIHFIKNNSKTNNKNDDKISMLKLLLKIQCERNNVAPKLIANAKQIEQLVINPKDNLSILSGFRYEVFGQYAKALLNGEISLTLLNGKTQIVKTTPRAPKQS